MNLPVLILAAALFCYAAAFVFHLWFFTRLQTHGHQPAFALLQAGFLLHTFYFAAEAVETGFFLPVSNLPETLAFFAWSIAFVYLTLLAKAQSESFGLILTPFLLILTGSSIATYHFANDPFVIPGNPLFVVHIVSAFFAYASFTISFAAGILYLIQSHELKMKKTGTFYHKLPSLEALEKLVFLPMIWGVILLILALLIGFVWSKYASGKYWLFDPKTVITSVTAAVYAGILSMRYIFSLRAKLGAFLALAAFCVLLAGFLGVRLTGSSHNELEKVKYLETLKAHPAP